MNEISLFSYFRNYCYYIVCEMGRAIVNESEIKGEFAQGEISFVMVFKSYNYRFEGMSI